MSERFVYVHGVVGREAGAHTARYRAFRHGLVRHGRTLPGVGGPESIEIAWGWGAPGAGRTANLALAQSALQRVIGKTRPQERLELGMVVSVLTAPIVNPVRELLLLAWPDVVYYVGEKGKRRTRRAVWRTLLERIPPGEPIDLTFVAHSGGTLIAHDFLFWLYSGERDHRLPAIEDGGEGNEAGFRFQERWMLARENWRVRRLVTLGSPLAPLMVRSAELTDRIATSAPPWLRFADVGLNLPSHAGPLPLWLNVWDRHDVLSFPVADLYDGDRVLDLYPDHSDWVGSAAWRILGVRPGPPGARRALERLTKSEPTRAGTAAPWDALPLAYRKWPEAVFLPVDAPALLGGVRAELAVPEA